MKYKLLVIDVGDTLLNGELEITQHTINTLLKVQQIGIRIVLTSGRPRNGITEFARMLELHHYGGYIMPYNGGQIINAQTEELLYEKRIDTKMVPYLERKASESGFSLFTYHKDFILTNDDRNRYIINEAKINHMRLIKAEKFSEDINFQACKFMLVGENESKLQALENHWEKHLNGVLNVFMSEPYFLEVVPSYVDKGNSLGILMDKLSIKPEEVVAIGDGVSDVSMIQMAGTGIAMGNARTSVIRCADRVTKSNEEDGVADAVERVILSAIAPTAISLKKLNENNKASLISYLGIQYTYASANRIEATMPVDERTRQPFGILHGGATLALAETIAGAGSMFLCKPDEIVVGLQVSGNHISSAHEGDTVRAVGTIIHKGRSSHVWNVDVFTSTDKLVSSVRVVNSILKKG